MSNATTVFESVSDGQSPDSANKNVLTISQDDGRLPELLLSSALEWVEYSFKVTSKSQLDEIIAALVECRSQLPPA